MPRRTNRSVVYSELMRWEPLEVKGSEGYAWIKTLSKDPETGAKTALIKYDPGFKCEASRSTWPMDIYVLNGEMQCGKLRYEKDTYHYRPAGMEIGPVSSPSGVTRLVFTADSRAPGKSSTKEVFIQSVVRDRPWDTPKERAAYTATSADRKTSSDSLLDESKLRGSKTLRNDPIAKASIWVYSAKRGGIRNMVGEMHMHVYCEEVFLVEGENYEYLDEVDGHVRWVPGTYLCRPPGECLHGDTLKLTDNHYLIVRTGYTDDPKEAAEWKAREVKSTLPLRTQTFDE